MGGPPCLTTHTCPSSQSLIILTACKFVNHTIHFVLQVVGATLRAMQVLLDRLSALQMMLMQRPVLSGQYTSAPYHHMLQPLDSFVMAVMNSAIKLGGVTAEVLSERCTQASLDAVHAEIRQLESLRYVPHATARKRVLLKFLDSFAENLAQHQVSGPPC